MKKRNFKKLLDFHHSKTDYTLAIRIHDGILTCHTYIPEGNEAFFYQELVEHPDTNIFSVDYKDFITVIDTTVKAKYPFHFSFDDTRKIIEVIEEHDEGHTKVIGEIKFNDGGEIAVPVLNTEDEILSTAVDSQQFSNLQLHDSIKTNLDLYPEFSGVTCSFNSKKLIFLSTDVASILATCVDIEPVHEPSSCYFQIAATSIKNLKLFSKECTCQIYKNDKVTLEFSEITDEEHTLKSIYRIAGNPLSESFYMNEKISAVLNQLQDISYQQLLSASKEDIKLLKNACTKCRSESTWDDKRSVIFHFNKGIYLYDDKLLDLPENDTITGRIPGYNLTAVLNIPTVYKTGKKKEERYEMHHGEMLGLHIFKNQNVYLID